MKFFRNRVLEFFTFCFFIAVAFVFTCLVQTKHGNTTIIKKMDLNDLVEKADIIFVGRVTEIDIFWDNKHENIWTSVTFSITQNIKGNNTDTKTIKLLGGIIEEENIGIKVYEMPIFEYEDTGLIFLKDKPNLYCPIVGWFQGRFRIYKDKETGKDIVEDNEGRVISRFNAKEKKLLKKLSKDDEKYLLKDFLTQINSIIKNK